MHFKRFEDMPVWQDARRLTRMIYKATGNGKFKSDFGLSNQIQRSSVSIMSNIAEGYERVTKKELLLFLGYAKASSGEVRSHLHVAKDLAYVDELQFEEIHNLCTSISSQLTRFSQYLRK